MRRNTPLVALGVTQLATVGLALAFFLKVRPRVLAEHQLQAEAFGWPARFAMNSWGIPLLCILGSAVVLYGAFGKLSQKRRMHAMATGVTFTSLTFTVSALATFASSF